jgi:hypothetical protein
MHAMVSWQALQSGYGYRRFDVDNAMNEFKRNYNNIYNNIYAIINHTKLFLNSGKVTRQ